MSVAEEWRAVVGFEGFYEVSDLGRVRSLDRVTVQKGKGGCTMSRLHVGRVLSPMIARKRHGYRYVNLRREGAQKFCRVPVLVAAAFIGPRPPGLLVCHQDGGVIDDRPGNLRYGTPKSNSADMVGHGTRQRGETCPNARLTEVEARFIKFSSISPEQLGERFGIHPGHVNNIRSGARWAHLPAGPGQ